MIWNHQHVNYLQHHTYYLDLCVTISLPNNPAQSFATQRQIGLLGK